jgi:hypothetical protein
MPHRILLRLAPRLFPLLAAALFLMPQQAKAWGFWAHQRINRLAVFTLPPELLGIYKGNIDYITEHATDPDNRRYAVDGEAPRHYLDADHYGVYPFEALPRRWKDAVEKYSEDTLKEHGIVPWHMQVEYYNLVDAFKAKDLERILKTSADFGHYIADAHVPLHTTSNYNGQYTGQKGIHGLWESRLPELFGESYDFYLGQAQYIEHPLNTAWDCVLESNAALDSVLRMELLLTEKFPADRKYSYENRNDALTRVYSLEFCKAYHKVLDGMVERRMRMAVLRVGSFWYSAWIDAGQPDLSELVGVKLERKKDNYEKKLKIIDRESGDVSEAGADSHQGHACGESRDCQGEGTALKFDWLIASVTR